MKNLVYFLMVGFVFTILQVATVGAQAGDPNAAPPVEDPNAAPLMDGEDDLPPLEDMDLENMDIEDMFPAPPEDEEGEGAAPPAE